MTSDQMILGAALLVMLAYAYLAARLSRTFQPLRLQVANNIEDLLADQSIPRSFRDDLDRLGRMMFSTKAAWLMVITYPLGVFNVLRQGSRVHPKLMSHPKHREIAQTFVHGIICMMATSPICFLLFVIEVIMLMLFWAPLGRSARSALHIVFQFMNGRQGGGRGSAIG
ncbi:hypothetical protein [Defluviimonas sp. SAOS-178_SWC]|uniref:hypothetical protein n=1 Tax=Defluviimonas sp. SAOS-178_SWC TaxID=3121287 RepID=UPI0032219A9B